MEELKQEINNGGKIASPGEPHVPCVLLVDTSGSMNENEKINSLNNGIKKFLEITQKDDLTSRIADLAIIEFNNDVKVIQEFTPIMKLNPVNLTAGGGTAMGNALITAIDKIKERRREYYNLGTPCYMPWIFMITDGEPTDDIQPAIERIKIEEHKGKNEDGKIRTVAIGVPGYNEEILKKITPRCVGVNDEDLEKICTWIAENLKIISFSSVTNTMPKLKNLPENAQIIPNYWND